MTDYPGQSGSGQGGILGEIRRQMEEMLSGSRPPAPTMIPSGETSRRGRSLGEGSQTGLAVAAMASYWAIPLLGRKRIKRRLKKRRERAAAQRTAGDTGQAAEPQDE